MAVNKITEAKVNAAVTISEQSPASVSSEISTNSPYSFANSSYGANYGGIQYPTKCERNNNSKAGQNEGPVSENVDEKATKIAPLWYFVDVASMLNDKNR